MLLDRLSSLARRPKRPERVWSDPREMAGRYDVAVVGGGVRALAIARAVAGEGASVALLAPGEISAARDERAWPVLRAGQPDARRAASDAHAAQAARKAIRGASSVGFDRAGCLTTGSSAHEVETLTRRAVELKAQGVEVWMVPAREIAALSPPFVGDQGFSAALYEPNAEVVDADALALSLAEAAAAAGAALFPATPAQHLERDGDGRATGLQLGDRTVLADAIVLADDLSAIRLVREGKGRLSLVRDERSILTTAGGAPSIGPALEIGDLRISRDRAGAIAASGPSGGDGVALELVTLAPSLGGLEVASDEPVIVWRGIDGLAQVGEAEISGLWLALGYGRDALSLAPTAAEHLAALVAGRRGLKTLAPFAPTRRTKTLEAAR